MLKVLFGSIEYFEQEMMSLAKRRNYIHLAHEQVIEIYSEIKNELINDFICDQNIKNECLNNLNIASQRSFYKYQILA